MLTRHHNYAIIKHMGTLPRGEKRRAAGRPRTSKLTRAEQLRLAKRMQRQREAERGVAEVRLKLPSPLARRFLFASRQPGFLAALTKLLDAETIEVSRYPQLKLLCWNRRNQFLGAEDAWNLYERNWRFIEPDRLEASERRLIESLASRFGGGLMYG
jgi:hypothetical protein